MSDPKEENQPICKVDANGDRIWYLNGVYHREDGPAVEGFDGSKEWWFNGALHRQDGPAIEEADGTKEWYLNGKLHREDGPAVEYANGRKEWWLNGVRVKKSDLTKIFGNKTKRVNS